MASKLALSSSLSAAHAARQQASALRDAVEHSRRRARFHEAQYAIEIARFAPPLSVLFAHYASVVGPNGSPPAAMPPSMAYADLEAMCSETGVLPLLVTRTRLARLFELCSALRGSGLLQPADLGACLAAVATTALTSIATPQARVNALFCALGLDHAVADVRTFLRAAVLLRSAATVPMLASTPRGEVLAAALRSYSAAPVPTALDVHNAASVPSSRDPLLPLRDANTSPSRRRKPGRRDVRSAIAEGVDVAGVARSFEDVEPTAAALCEGARRALRRFERETIRARISHDGAAVVGFDELRPESPLRAAPSDRRSVLESIALGL